METQPVKSTRNEIMKHLRSMFPDQKVPDPINIHVTDWTSNPFSYGSYSAISLGTTGLWNLGKAMRKSEKNLYFAGEHTANNFGFVHSAFDTGTSTAKTLIKRLRKVG